MDCPYGAYSTTNAPGATSILDCTCDPKVTYSGSDRVCIPCANCRPGFRMLPPSSGAACTAASAVDDSTRCQPCAQCQPGQHISPGSICNGTQQADSQALDGSCTTCTVACPAESPTMVTPCHSGSGSVDTTMCIAGYRSIKSMACPNNQYLAINPINYATTLLPATTTLPNADGSVFAEMYPGEGVKIYSARSFDDAIATDSSETPVMSYLPPLTKDRIIASIVWSLDGTTLFVIRMDAVVVRMRVFPVWYRGVDERWSAPSSLLEKPFSSQPNSPSVPVCVALPQRPVDWRKSAVERQVTVPLIVCPSVFWSKWTQTQNTLFLLASKICLFCIGTGQKNPLRGRGVHPK